jgi:hypothetical protein
MKDSGHTYNFYLNNFFFNGSFEYGYGVNFKLLRWMQNLHQTPWDHETLYADRSWKDKQLLRKIKMRKWRAVEI